MCNSLYNYDGRKYEKELNGIKKSILDWAVTEFIYFLFLVFKNSSNSKQEECESTNLLE